MAPAFGNLGSKLRRRLAHAATGTRDLARRVPPDAQERLARAVIESERRHGGEIRVALESSLDPSAIWAGTTARERAIEVFSDLRVWDTEANNGVLLYLLLADHDVEIVADRGANRAAGDGAWEAICGEMKERFARGEFEAGLLRGVEAVSAILERHFPLEGGRGPNELPDAPLVLG